MNTATNSQIYMYQVQFQFLSIVEISICMHANRMATAITSTFGRIWLFHRKENDNAVN